MIKMILAVDEKEWIWKNNSLAWSIKDDLKFFQKETTSWNKMNILIMWRKTYESLPEQVRPLKNRINFVVSKNAEMSQYFDVSNKEWPYYFDNIEKCLFNSRMLWNTDLINDIYLIWWSSIYENWLNENLDIIDEIIVTKVFWDYECDTKVNWLFKILETHFIWENESEILVETDENWKEHKFQFVRYRKKTN